MGVEAVVFDMDGVLVQTEEVWDEIREALTRERGGAWREDAHETMMGMSTPEWSGFMARDLGLAEAGMSPEEIAGETERRLMARYAEDLPLIDGAVDAVERLAGAGYALAVASSSTRGLIETVLDAAGIRARFGAAVSSEEVARGKPAPDVFLEAARRLGVAPERCAAVEDSGAGLRAARAAGMHVIAVPNPGFPPGADALAAADVVLPSIRDLHPQLLAGAPPA